MKNISTIKLSLLLAAALTTAHVGHTMDYPRDPFGGREIQAWHNPAPSKEIAQLRMMIIDNPKDAGLINDALGELAKLNDNWAALYKASNDFVITVARKAAGRYFDVHVIDELAGLFTHQLQQFMQHIDVRPIATIREEMMSCLREYNRSQPDKNKINQGAVQAALDKFVVDIDQRGGQNWEGWGGHNHQIVAVSGFQLNALWLLASRDEDCRKILFESLSVDFSSNICLPGRSGKLLMLLAQNIGDLINHEWLCTSVSSEDLLRDLVLVSRHVGQKPVVKKKDIRATMGITVAVQLHKVMQTQAIENVKDVLRNAGNAQGDIAKDELENQLRTPEGRRQFLGVFLGMDMDREDERKEVELDEGVNVVVRAKERHARAQEEHEAAIDQQVQAEANFEAGLREYNRRAEAVGDVFSVLDLVEMVDQFGIGLLQANGLSQAEYERRRQGATNEAMNVLLDAYNEAEQNLNGLIATVATKTNAASQKARQVVELEEIVRRIVEGQ